MPKFFLMKNRFEEFSVLNKSSILSLFKDCIFVFDTNVLLNMYRYSEETSSSWFDALTRIKERVYLPYIVGYEFYKNRLETIEAENRIPNKMQNELEKFSKALEKQFQDNRRLNDKNGELKKLLDKIQKNLDKIINYKKIDIYDDHILKKIEAIFSNKVVGKELTEEEKNKLTQEAKRRFDEKIPPGYEDAKKNSPEQYNDFLFWNDVLVKAATDKVDIILVTDDVKSDWWRNQVNENKAIHLPHPYLRKEFHQKTKKKYFQLRPGEFIGLLTEYVNQKIDQNVISETNEVSQASHEGTDGTDQNNIREIYLDRIKSRYLDQENDSLLRFYSEEEARRKALIDLVVGDYHRPDIAKAFPELKINLEALRSAIPKMPILEFPKIPVPEIPKMPIPEFLKIPVPEIPKMPIPEFPKIPVPNIQKKKKTKKK